MAEEEQLSKSSKILTFVSAKRGFGSALPIVAIAVLAAAIVVDKKLETFESLGDSAGAVAVLIFTCIVVLAVTRRWTAEVDPVARRLTIFKTYMLRWTTIMLRTTIIERCSFDECSMLGTTIYDAGDLFSYGVYLDFKRGGRHLIPVKNGTLGEAVRAASELSAATGIPRQDEVR